MEAILSLNTWKRFMNEGTLETTRINDHIVKSWHRCKDANLNPQFGVGQHVLKDNIFHLQKDKNTLFLDSALPHLDRMKKFTDSLGMLVTLIDPEGYILSLTGNQNSLNRAKKINFVEGVLWTEGEVGTNAIGTALQNKEPIIITGTEHYAIASHEWSCSAAPIHNDEGKLMGIFNISCPVNNTHPYMLGMVTAIAYTIENELSIRMHKDELELINSTLNLIDSDHLILVYNCNQMIVGASKPIRQNIQRWTGMTKNLIKKYGFDTQLEIPIYSKVHGRVIGKCLYLIEGNPQELHPIIRKPLYFKGEAGTSYSFQCTLDEIKRVAASDASVYIFGETGTGKEVIAQSIHENSSRQNGPLISVNCGAIPKDLLESELFGYVEGAFTGAGRKGFKGKFEQANHGTLFLDEIGEIPHSMQVTLLRVLQERKVTPIGSNQEIPLDIRIITATHRELSQLVSEGKFREDLYYRLYVYPVHVPPLRERKEDIPHLVRYFCEKYNWNEELPSELFDRLMEYHWPGNIRELFNVLERLQVFSQNEKLNKSSILNWLDTISKDRINPSSNDKQPKSEVSTQHVSLSYREKVQKELMMNALQKTEGNVSLAAKLLKMPRSTFYNRLQKFGL